VTGYVDFPRFQAALAACDLAVNLRYPTAGETSASLLRLLAAGRGAVVSDFAQFVDLPAEVAVRVPLGEGEIDALAALLPGLLADGEALARMGEAARRHVALETAPETAAAAVAAACRELAAAPPPGDRPADPGAPTTVTCRALAAGVVVEGLEAPWAAGERRRLNVRLANRGPCRWLPARSGPGGVAFAVRLETPAGDPDPARPWLPLPRELAPGEATSVAFELRRPPGPARLSIVPLVLGGWAGDTAERPAGAAWEAELP
jgi:hypothetical protein